MSSRTSPDRRKVTEVTSKIITAWLDRNHASASDIALIIRSVGASVDRLAFPVCEVVGKNIKPAVPIKRSITADAIICLECGGGYQSLKRHLQTTHCVTVNDYLTRWSLPKSYPLTTLNYRQRRAESCSHNTGEAS